MPLEGDSEQKRPTFHQERCVHDNECMFDHIEQTTTFKVKNPRNDPVSWNAQWQLLMIQYRKASVPKFRLNASTLFPKAISLKPYAFMKRFKSRETERKTRRIERKRTLPDTCKISQSQCSNIHFTRVTDTENSDKIWKILTSDIAYAVYPTAIR